MSFKYTAKYVRAVFISLLLKDSLVMRIADPWDGADDTDEDYDVGRNARDEDSSMRV